MNEEPVQEEVSELEKMHPEMMTDEEYLKCLEEIEFFLENQ